MKKYKLDDYMKFHTLLTHECPDLDAMMSVLLMKLLQTSPYEEINEIKFRYLDVGLPNKIIFNGFQKFGTDNMLIVRLKPTQYLILSSSKNYPAKEIVEKLKEKHGGKGGGSPTNAQILFDKEPKNLQEDIKHILTN